MKKVISNLGGNVLSREQMKRIKGGYESVNEGTCSHACSIKGNCAAAASGRGCECSTHDGGTC